MCNPYDKHCAWLIKWQCQTWSLFLVLWTLNWHCVTTACAGIDSNYSRCCSFPVSEKPAKWPNGVPSSSAAWVSSCTVVAGQQGNGASRPWGSMYMQPALRLPMEAKSTRVPDARCLRRTLLVWWLNDTVSVFTSVYPGDSWFYVKRNTFLRRDKIIA